RDVIDIDPGLATVKVSHGTLRDESRQVRLDPGDNELRFQLRPGLELSGTVRSYDGAPLALATVEADTEYSRNLKSHQTNTVSDQSGAFRITGLEPRRYILTARSPGYADGGPDEPVEIGDEAIEGIEIVLEPEASIVGVITGLSPADLNHARVYARKGPRSRDATTDTEGNFSVRGIGPGGWVVRGVKGDWERTVERTVTIEPGMTEVFVELPFERGLRLSGQVIEDGAPLRGAMLSVGDVTVRADHEGRFAMEGLEAGPNEVFVSRPDYTGSQYHSIDLQTDLEGVRIELEPAAATVTGVVVDALTGQPIYLANLVTADAATIGAIAADQAADASFVGASSSFSWPEGTFELELRRNADHLWITRDGYESAQIPLNIAPGEHMEGLVIRLQPAPPDAPDQ
ncbi:MAG: carboxypeptidase regulatory-like domain-containing protein, partial [Acidobacteria bacterium]|nr:carboxypeptidase regulatory-like domain-containing protein [Acidobacteriota bacterium]